MTLPLTTSRKFRILHFDIENRPLSYWFGDVTTSDITAIAASWSDQKKIEVYLQLTPEDVPLMLEWFASLYEEADMVTGHYIRKHDLPIVSAAMADLGMAPLGTKLTSDTKIDLKKRWGVPSTQEYLAGILGISAPKVGMSQSDWRQANAMIPAGIELVRKRVVGDVKQHKAMYKAMVDREWLKEPKDWRP